jgi:hypothetical protein
MAVYATAPHLDEPMKARLARVLRILTSLSAAYEGETAALVREWRSHWAHHNEAGLVAFADQVHATLLASSEEKEQISDKWREAFARSANLAVENWERDVSPKIAGIRMDRIINMLLERATGAEAALREIASQCHNLPRSATADRIETLARGATTDSPNG